MRDSQVFCRKVIKMICDEQDILDCTKSNTDILKAPELIFEVDKATVVFEGNEYLYFDDKTNRVNCRFSWIISIRSNGCDDDTDIAVGRLFYQKLQPVFKYNQDGTSELIFTKNYNLKHKTNWTYVVIGIIIVLFVLFLIAFILHRKKQQEDEKYFEV